MPPSLAPTMKYIVVSGGVISGIGKGVIASSTGLLLRTLGLRVTAIKIDPYMNIDAGTMAPTEHGEVFVLNDGGEVDLDLGNYERYLNVTLGRDNNITTGKIYRQVIEKERRGDYLGKTVQIVPHLTDAIQDWIECVAAQPVDESSEMPDVCIVELGGTVGDIESAPFVEALRQFQFRVGHDNFALIHVSLIPVIGGEQKTKPTQAAIRDLRGLGLAPDMIAARCAAPLERNVIQKLSLFCHVGPEQVLGVHDVNSTYHVPLLLEAQGMVRFLEQRLRLDLANAVPAPRVQAGLDLRQRWKELTVDQERSFEVVDIVLVGKYTALQDSYMSVVKALEHASMRCRRKLRIHWVESGDLEAETESLDPVKYHQAWQNLCSAKGIIVPGGFGKRGTEGMVLAVRWAREKRVPFLGICLGFQLAVVEFARHVCGRTEAQSAELVETTTDPVVVYMPEVSRTHLGGTMRLGLRPTLFSDESESRSKIRQLYGGAPIVWERHRHRYEINPEIAAELEKGGPLSSDKLVFIGKNEKGNRMQVAEIHDHPYFVGMQAHPELASRPLNPSPPFLGLVAAASGLLEEQIQVQLRTFKPPHPQSAMVLESEAPVEPSA
ncbi:unnamed protein product [Malassezia sympodialis ATCC 42132]|uniref:CTP synthase n=1 Tax=Malassezia sympodialis (strain ATCC 42132) TaxID=1230383 RepID=M5E8L1_MALS4|nr:uncharacterized protein MSY001_1646 [Malassezia sympodialis ATCC 42132]CCU98940.1 unnamed protein product [Malassezia sympodialis ATCC 42132]SHO78962.1 Major CTP synthase isozyme (see also URA8) [Malassezia sympodialis ATCC 42132]|eukprot:XP_018740215.1 uncharacterized protein MSY001_1646 [Malassezia sympodialis ATCC 42132]